MPKFTLERNKITKGTVRYTEVAVEEGQRRLTIYLPKELVKGMDEPDTITMTIEAKKGK